ncbi:MAG: class I mannose-6-phosphate isomerase [Paludibacteraceae bacterium]|nr:class I mannose-6-phosphate isomerase [Paludibacteraceae bacterium]MBP6284987.1 class I mannose-6-phosphate isomerase [Paludibacteraceae bacterium]
MKLYPLIFEAIFHERIWGGKNLATSLGKRFDGDLIGESWELSGLPNNESIVKEGALAGKTLNVLIATYKEELVGTKIYNRFENSFPLLFKYLDACENLSVQVHPGNEMAQEKHQCDGKTEMWYVVEADADAKIIAGLKENVNFDMLKNAIENESIEDLLHFHKAEKGDVFHITEGIIHALGKGTVVAEIQQSSDITYRIHDYNRKDKHGNTRELHTEEALACTVLQDIEKTQVHFSETESRQTLVSCPYFTTNLLSINKPTQYAYDFVDSFVVYMSIEGNYTLQTQNSSIAVKKGDTILLPANIKKVEFIPAKGEKLTILETYIL